MRFLFTFCFFIAAFAQLSMSHEVGLISSYKLTPGLQSLNQERDISKPISIEKFTETGVSMVKMCHSYSYIFINLPGVTITDFMENERSFPELQKYLELSSSIAKYEKIDFHEQDPAKIYKDVIRATRLGCNISLKNVLQVEGNNTDSFVPYYDTAPRIIKIDFPEMPTHGTSMAEKRARTTALKEFDKFIGYVLGHLPTPEFSMMLTTSPGSGNLEDVMKNEDIEINESAGIFPSVFNVKSRSKEYERNQRPKKIPKPQFKPYVPMQQSMIEKAQIYPTAFSIDFLIENEDILVKVLTSLVVSIALYFFMANPLDKGPALKKGKLVKNTEKQGKLDTLAPAKTTVTNIKRLA